RDDSNIPLATRATRDPGKRLESVQSRGGILHPQPECKCHMRSIELSDRPEEIRGPSLVALVQGADESIRLRHRLTKQPLPQLRGSRTARSIDPAVVNPQAVAERRERRRRMFVQASEHGGML